MPTTRFKGPLLASSESGAGLFEDQDITEPGRFHTTQYHEDFDSRARLGGIAHDKGLWKQSTAYQPYDNVYGYYGRTYNCVVQGTSAASPAPGLDDTGVETIVDKLGNDREVITLVQDGTIGWKYLPEYYASIATDWRSTNYLGRQGQANILYPAYPEYQNSGLGVIELTSGAEGSSDTVLTGVTIQNNGNSSNGPLGVLPMGNPTVAEPADHVASTISFGCRINMYNKKGQDGIDAGSNPYLKCNWFVGLSSYEVYNPVQGITKAVYDPSQPTPQGPGSFTHAGFFMKGNDTGRLWAGCKGWEDGAGVHIDIGEMPPLREGIGGWVELGMKIVDADCFMIYRRDEGQSTRWKQVAEGMLPEGSAFDEGASMYPTLSNSSADQIGSTFDESYGLMALGVDYFFLNQKRDLFHPEWDGERSQSRIFLRN